jgi:hypothetical protein
MSWVLIILLLTSSALWFGYEQVRWRLPGQRKKTLQLAAAHIERTLAPCAACGASLKGHSIHEALAQSKPEAYQVADIDRAVRSHAWNSLRGLRFDDWTADALAYWFVECPNTGRGVMYRVESRAGFDDDDQIDLIEILSQEETARCQNGLQLGEGLPL